MLNFASTIGRNSRERLLLIVITLFDGDLQKTIDGILNCIFCSLMIRLLSGINRRWQNYGQKNLYIYIYSFAK